MEVSLAPILSADKAPGRAAPGDRELLAIVASLGDELSRPLRSLREGFDRMQADGPVTADQSTYLQTMIALCDDLHRLIGSYQDYSELELGVRAPRFATAPVGRLIREWDRRFAPAAADRRRDWSCSLEGPDATVTVDAACIERVLAHLVDNAWKNTPEAGRVCISARVEGPRWFVTVADDGPGIPAEAQARVFEPFFRLPRDERAGLEGHGLGLAICRELVEQLSGEISLTSEPGQGTRVTINLPAAPRPEPLKPKGKRPPAVS
jgi:two-component system sensor histidine kinase EvgS